MYDYDQDVGKSASIEFDLEKRYETIEQDKHIILSRRERKPLTQMTTLKKKWNRLYKVVSCTYYVLLYI